MEPSTRLEHALLATFASLLGLETRAALEALRSWVTTEQLLDQLHHRLCDADIADVGQAIADELGVTIDDWHGYHALRHAADRYQHARHPTTPTEGARDVCLTL